MASAVAGRIRAEALLVSRRRQPLTWTTSARERPQPSPRERERPPTPRLHHLLLNHSAMPPCWEHAPLRCGDCE
jgi:hypothetical protein